MVSKTFEGNGFPKSTCSMMNDVMMPTKSSTNQSFKDRNLILILSPSSTGGGWNMFYRFLKYYSKVDRPKYALKVLTLGKKDNRLDELKEVDIKLRKIAWLDYNKYVHRLESKLLMNLFFCSPLFIASSFYAIRNRSKMHSVISNGFLAAIPLILFKIITRNSQIRIFPWIHTDGRFSEKPIRKLIGYLARHVDIFFVNSRDIENDLLACGIESNKIKIVTNWIDIQELTEQQRRQFHDNYGSILDRYRYIVTYVGRFVEYKHFLLYLQVAERLASEDIGFVFVGNGELIDRLKQITNNNRNVHMFKGIPDQEVRYILHKANITLTYADENYLGLSAYESLSMGTPVIYADVSCAPAKYYKKVRISKDLLPEDIGFKNSDSIDSIAGLILSLKERNYPSGYVRQRCKEHIKRCHHEDNARVILENIFG